MKKLLLLGLIASFSFPALAFAAMYDYVTTAGTIRTVEANTPEQAIATAPNIDPHSGVIFRSNGSVPPLTFGPNIPTAGGAHLYQYVDRSGVVRSVRADSPAQAIMIAPNIDPHSGVMLVP